MRNIFLILMLIYLFISCGTDNLAKKYVKKTPCQEAKEYLNAKEYDKAIEVLETAITDDPTNYSLYTLYAAAYSAKAGVDILSIAQNQFTSQSDGGGTFLDQISAFLPSSYTRTEIEFVDKAVKKLQAIPSDLRVETSSTDYGESAYFQLTLYQSVYSVMYINLFVKLDASGNINTETLQKMTPEDAVNIIESLRSAAGDDSELGQMMDEAITQIDGVEGADDREKLINFLEEQQTQQQPQK